MTSELERLISVVARLRGPGGCPWDREQTFRSLLPYLLEESAEYIEAVESGDSAHMREELGDVLLQVALHARIAQEQGLFDIEQVAAHITEKLIRRHPHVFGDTSAETSREVARNWDRIKLEEKGGQHPVSRLDGVPRALSSLLRAQKVQKRAAKVGFDWADIGPALDKVEEEFRELRAEIESGDTARAEDELGDILFALVNVARHHGMCAEIALRRTTGKFMRRFRYIEQRLAQLGKQPEESSLEEMDSLWEECKRIERQTPRD